MNKLAAVMIVAKIAITSSFSDWDLPVFPDLSSEISNRTNVLIPKIPKNVYIPFKESPQDILDHLKTMVALNTQWKFHFVGNNEKLLFMETFFFS